MSDLNDDDIPPDIKALAQQALADAKPITNARVLEATGLRPPAAKAPVIAPELSAHPGVEADTSFDDEFSKGQQAEANAAETMFPTLPQRGRGPTDAVQPEGENFLPTRGKDLFQETYVQGPKDLAASQKQLGELEGQRHEAIAGRYAQETERATGAMAANQARRQAEDLEIQTRQANLDRATKTYTDDLHDQNKFWQSPGNILSAIAFSLMPIFSNDPTIGAKLINQAIDRDMTNRKDLANMHLGELRSNIGMYRKLAEDHQVGDQIAQAEAHRIAAQDIERISQQFQSPISKTKAQAMAQDQLMRANQVQMTAYNHYNYNAARRLDPRLASAYEMPGKQGNPDGWKSFAIPNGSPGKAAVGSIAGTPSVASSEKNVANMSQTQVAALAHHPEEIANMAIDGRLKGDDILRMHRNSIVARAKSITDENSPKYELEFNKNIQGLRKEAEEGVMDVAKAMAPHEAAVATTSRLARDMAVIKSECAEAGINPNDFLGELRTGLGGPLTAKLQDLRIRFNNDATDNATQKNQMERLKASERFHQALAGNIVGYYHDMAGAAQNKKELENLGQYISAESSWNKIEQFVNERSQTYAKVFQNALRESKSPYSAALYVAGHGNGTPSLPYQGIAKPVPKTGRPTPLAPKANSRTDEPQGRDEFTP